METMMPGEHLSRNCPAPGSKDVLNDTRFELTYSNKQLRFVRTRTHQWNVATLCDNAIFTLLLILSLKVVTEDTTWTIINGKSGSYPSLGLGPHGISRLVLYGELSDENNISLTRPLLIEQYWVCLQLLSAIISESIPILLNRKVWH